MSAAGWGLALAGAGLGVAAVTPAVTGLVVAALLIGAGVGVATPLAFASLARAAPAGRMGQTMGAAEVGRELGDAGGPLAVGALAVVSLAAGFAGLAAVVLAAAGVTVPRCSRAHAADGLSIGSER